MWPYYVLVLYVLLIVAFFKPKIGERRGWKYSILIIPLFVFAALRGNGNGDYFTYLDRGEYVKSWNDVLHGTITGMEIGYRAIAYFVRILKIPRQFTIVFMNALSLSTVTYFIKKISKDWCLSLLLFIPLYFQFDLHAARTAVAIGFCAVGYKFVKERCLVKYLICVALGCMFHMTAIITIPLYFFYGKNISLKNGILIIGFEMMTVRFIGIYTMMNYMFDILHLDIFIQKLASYTSSDTYGYMLKLYDPRIWIGIAVFFIAKKSITEKDHDENFMCNGVFLYSFILILFSNTTFFAYRLSAFYYINIVSLVPSIVLKYHYHKNKNILVYDRRITVFYTCCFVFTMLNLVYASKVVEYKTVFETGFGLLPY